MSKPIKILIVCLGNICRSPMAESVLKSQLNQSKLNTKVEVDSAGTASYHVGDYPDERTIKVLMDQGIMEYSRARKIQRSDFEEFDYILGMDNQNLKDIKSIQPIDSKSIVALFGSFDINNRDQQIDDPYYGSSEDFKVVFRQSIAAAQGLISHLKKNH